jgi:short-subunit dehydrogenase
MRATAANPRVTLVTGAASGIGACAARLYAARGVRVAALDCDAARLTELRRQVPAVTTCSCDVSDENTVQRTVKEVETGLGPIDRVLHCAGIAPLGRLLDQPMADIERILRANYLGTVHIAKATVPAMIDRGEGEFAVIASIAGWLPMADIGAYGASKAAMITFCEVLAAECRGSGVRVTCACPSAVETPMLEALRHSHPHVANDQRGMPPRSVVEAVEKALAHGKLFIFPGRGTTTAWRARRYAPGLLTGLLERNIKKAPSATE